MVYQALIVDDEEIVCRGLARFVKWEEHGFEVAGTAYNVDAALDFLHQNHVDVVFMDIRMPQRSGLELLRILHAEYPEVKPVILSGYSDFSYAQEAIRFGAVDYLTKPVSLGQVAELLDRLFLEFEQQKQTVQIHASRLEALLLSAARGYSRIDPGKYQFTLPQRWHGMSVGLPDRTLNEEALLSRKELIRQQLGSLSPGSILLDDNVYSLFAIIPCPPEVEFDSLASALEQFCPEFAELPCGISKPKGSVSQLHEAWTEAGHALRYCLAGSRKGMIYYQNVETLFTQESLTMQELLPELLRRLNDPDDRAASLPLVHEALHQYQNQTITQYQTSCIRFLIELSSHIQGMELPGVSLHAPLNETLGRILFCQEHQSTAACTADYVQWLVQLLEQADTRRLAGGAVCGIQMFIRQHYSENITLNSLAEQFYLHPNYLSRLFKEKTGKNFVEYLTEVRMEKVKELLCSSDYKIIEICAMTGYDNPRYFSRVFKQYTGMTPREYRMEKGKPEHG